MEWNEIWGLWNLRLECHQILLFVLAIRGYPNPLVCYVTVTLVSSRYALLSYVGSHSTSVPLALIVTVPSPLPSPPLPLSSV